MINTVQSNWPFANMGIFSVAAIPKRNLSSTDLSFSSKHCTDVIYGRPQTHSSRVSCAAAEVTQLTVPVLLAPRSLSPGVQVSSDWWRTGHVTTILPSDWWR